jgi:hypothetical protein
MMWDPQSKYNSDDKLKARVNELTLRGVPQHKIALYVAEALNVTRPMAMRLIMLAQREGQDEIATVLRANYLRPDQIAALDAYLGLPPREREMGVNLNPAPSTPRPPSAPCGQKGTSTVRHAPPRQPAEPRQEYATNRALRVGDTVWSGDGSTFVVTRSETKEVKPTRSFSRRVISVIGKAAGITFYLYYSGSLLSAIVFVSLIGLYYLIFFLLQFRSLLLLKRGVNRGTPTRSQGRLLTEPAPAALPQPQLDRTLKVCPECNTPLYRHDAFACRASVLDQTMTQTIDEQASHAITGEEVITPDLSVEFNIAPPGRRMVCVMHCMRKPGAEDLAKFTAEVVIEHYETMRRDVISLSDDQALLNLWEATIIGVIGPYFHRPSDLYAGKKGFSNGMTREERDRIPPQHKLCAARALLSHYASSDPSA